jgi:AraC-like DNA-binding protein
MHTTPTISALLARLILRYLDGHMPDAHALFVRHQLAPHMLEERGASVPLLGLYGVLEEAQQALGDPLLGAQITQAWQVEDFEELGFLFYTSETLGDVLRVLMRFRALWSAGEELALSVRGATTELTWWPYGAPRAAHAIGAQLYATDMIQGCAKLLGQPLEITRVELMGAPLEPGAHAALEQMLGAPIRYGFDAATIALPTAQLARRMPSADPMLAEFFMRQVSAQAARLEVDGAVVPRLKALLRERLEGAPGLEEAARALAMSPRSLQRALAEEGSSFRRALDEVRRDEAARLIERGVALETAATRLGFGEERALWRAFQRWYGTTPAQWRRERV